MAESVAEPLRLGSIGLGWWGGSLAVAAAASGRGVVVNCFARSAAARTDFAAKHGCRAAASLEEILNDDEVEGLLVATPHSTHLSLIEAAAAAGKHVFVEKPLTLGMAEGRRAVEAAESAGVILQVGHHRRRQTATRELKRLIEAGELGQVHLLEANLSTAMGMTRRPGWRDVAEESPLGGMTALGVHVVDNLIYLAGRPKSVSAITKKLRGATNLDDVTTLIFEFESGPLGYVGTSLVLPKILTTAVFGTDGLAWSEEEGTRLFRQAPDQTSRVEYPVTPIDAIVDELAEFASCIRSGTSPEVDGAQALEVVAVLEASILSEQRKQVVEISEVL
jgi:predicted dehydrogenase